MFIYQSDVCRNGNIKNCPKGFSPYTKEIVYGGGWTCQSFEISVTKTEIFHSNAFKEIKTREIKERI
jgi:hypothetical protein